MRMKIVNFSPSACDLKLAACQWMECVEKCVFHTVPRRAAGKPGATITETVQTVQDNFHSSVSFISFGHRWSRTDWVSVYRKRKKKNGQCCQWIRRRCPKLNVRISRVVLFSKTRSVLFNLLYVWTELFRPEPALAVNSVCFWYI